MTDAEMIAALKNAAGVTAFCEYRIYWDSPTQQLKGQRSPYVVLSEVVGVGLNYLGSRTSMDRDRIQIDCYATTPQVARELAEECRIVFEPSGVLASKNGSTYDAETKLYVRSLDFSFLTPR